MEILYHVTPATNAPSILKNGLLPKNGKNSQACCERGNAIYFFPSREYMNDALGGWLGDLYDEEKLVCIMVKVPTSIVHKSDVDYERKIYQRVSPKNFIGEPEVV